MEEFTSQGGNIWGFLIFLVLIGGVGYTIWCKKQSKAGKGKCVWDKSNTDSK